MQLNALIEAERGVEHVLIGFFPWNYEEELLSVFTDDKLERFFSLLKKSFL